jgi:LacI family transcriptional regulator
VLLPFHTAQDFGSFDFSRIAAVQMDHCLIQPRLHTILPDHYVSMMSALQRLHELGYRRIGLCMRDSKDTRIKNKWSAAYHAFLRSAPECVNVPTLIEPQLTRARFLAWFRDHRPDVIVGHVQEMIEWLAAIRVRVPDDVGFLNLNVTERTGPCAGLDLEPRRLGAIAVEMVVGMLHRQERGVPARPHTVNLEALWVDGPTLRAPAN